MFHKTVLRLTGLYLVIIMSISVLFSVSLFELSTRELDRGLQRQGAFITELPATDYLLPPSLQRRFVEKRDELAIEAKAHIFANLLFANLAIFVLAGGLSYALAKRSLEPIEQAHRSLEQFTADASHELRTPIAAMRSEIEVALMQPKLSQSDMKQLLESNLEEIDSLTRLTGGLLSLARLEELPLDISAQRIKSIISSVIKKLSAAADEKNITVRSTYSRSNIQAKADKSAFQEALIVLVDNAIKYGNPDSEVTVEVSTLRDRVKVVISNEGAGIMPDALPHLFDRFYRADSSRSGSTAGHGLGLAIAKQLIERQRGSISITSRLGKATTATIILPLDNTKV